jgi:methionine-rich copper-binding protein CopC
MKLHKIRFTLALIILSAVAVVAPPTPQSLAAAPLRSALSPADGSSSVAVTTDLVITFNQAVEVGTGNITINKFHGGAVQTIDITSDKVSGWSTTVITINAADLDAGTDYYVNYPSTAFKNSLNEFASAITNNTTWNFTTAGTPWSGAGTGINPWQISSCNQLLSIDGKADYLDDFFIISNDINCTGTTVYPMKHGTSYFSGSFNGNNKTISGLSINCTTTHCGLFAQLSNNATVYDLVFSAPAVSSSTSHVGVIAGQSSTSSTRTTAQLKNIQILGGSVSGANYTASIVGYALNGVTESIQSSASVSGADYTGGIFGQMGSSITCTSTSNLTRLSDAQFSGPIGGKSRVGGIVGSFITSSSTDVCGVFNSTNSGNITATTSCSNVGGVVGSISKGTVHNSSNSGSIAASDCPSTGGVIGGMSGAMSAGASTSSHVSNSWNSGSVSGKWYIGGVVGYCDYGYSTLTRVFNIGSVASSSGQVGGIIGVSSCVIVDSFSHATVTSSSTAGGAIGDGGGVGGSVVEVQRVYSASNKGFLGRRDTSLLSGALCENSFWDTTLASTTPGNCATSTSPAGKTTSEMKTQATFTGWDFVGEETNGTNDYWAINATVNNGYPFLVGVGVASLSGGALWVAPDTTAPQHQPSLWPQHRQRQLQEPSPSR